MANQKRTAKKPPTKRPPRIPLSLNGNADKMAEDLGQTFAKRLNQFGGTFNSLSPLDTDSRWKPRVFGKVTKKINKGVYFTDNKTFNRTYRATEKAQDELFSTAMSREFFRGVAETVTVKNLDQAVDAMDLPSILRIPTQFSGYSIKDEVMQHPASAKDALFDHPHNTASAHAQMDGKRRAYVTNAMKKTAEANGSAEDIIKSGARAAIEFTLNHFTAPIGASDVEQYSRLKNMTGRQKVQLRRLQMKKRENLKKFYVNELGGTLRAPIPGETDAASQTRPWRDGLRLKITPLNTTSIDPEPPSPLRKLK